MAQNRMKQQADQHRSERSFTEGDQVFLRLQPYKQTSLKKRVPQKLAPKFYGPYQIIQRIGQVAYKLALPAHSKIHPVFHVSCLKKVMGSNCKVQTNLPELDEEGSIWLHPEVVLDTRERQLRSPIYHLYKELIAHLKNEGEDGGRRWDRSGLKPIDNRINYIYIYHSCLSVKCEACISGSGKKVSQNRPTIHAFPYSDLLSNRFDL